MHLHKCFPTYMKAALTYCQVTMLAILQSVSCNFPAVLAIIQPLPVLFR